MTLKILGFRWNEHEALRGIKTETMPVEDIAAEWDGWNEHEALRGIKTGSS